MGFLDRFSRQLPPSEPADEPLFNAPHLLSVKLLFAEKPVLDAQAVLAELRATYPQVHLADLAAPTLFYFPELPVQFAEGELPAQCSILVPDDQAAPNVAIAPEALQQNWHWPDALAAADTCRYELLLADLMTRTLPHPARVELVMYFLVAVVKVTQPQVIYAVGAQKLLEPASVVREWESPQRLVLAALVNVRLFNISNGQPGETVMDTLGLHVLGLPDVQVHSIGLDASALAGLLWNYAYYLFQQGDVIDSGNTIAGLAPDSQWRCDRQLALASPERMVLDVQPQ